jgi:Glycosyltransferase family 17.
MYFDEEMILDVRLNTLDKYVDYFIISESNFTHSGKRRDLNFDINKYKKFEDKIIYLIYDKEPSDVEAINENDHKNEKARKKIMNAVKRENGQRNYLQNGLKDAGNEDIILVSDVDEIPNLTNVNFTNFKNKIIQFKQDMFYYKFNLVLPKLDWTGTKGCRKKNLINLQWLRNIKDRKYSILRPDILLSNKKYSDIFFVENGGWHFTNIKSPKRY